MNFRFTLGVVGTLSAGLCYAGMGAIVKLMSTAGQYPGYLTVIFFQSLVALLIVMVTNVNRLSELCQTDVLGWHFVRAIFGFMMVAFAWLAVKHLSVATTVLLSNTAPFFLPLIAVFFCRQHVNPWVWLVIAVGLAGVLLIDEPHEVMRILWGSSGQGGVVHTVTQGSHRGWYALAGLLSGVSFAALLTVSGKLVKTEAVKTIVFYYFLFSTLFAAIPMLVFFSTVSFYAVMMMVALGVLFYCLQLSLNFGVKNTSVFLNGILFYSCVVFGLILDALLWHTRVSTVGYVGIAVVMLSCIGAIYLERQ